MAVGFDHNYTQTEFFSRWILILVVTNLMQPKEYYRLILSCPRSPLDD